MATPGPNLSRLTDFLRMHGWDDAGRDCWCKYQGMEASLVVRWLSTSDLAQLARLRSEALELLTALDQVLVTNKQGSLF